VRRESERAEENRDGGGDRAACAGAVEAGVPMPASRGASRLPAVIRLLFYSPLEGEEGLLLRLLAPFVQPAYRVCAVRGRRELVLRLASGRHHLLVVDALGLAPIRDLLAPGEDGRPPPLPWLVLADGLERGEDAALLVLGAADVIEREQLDPATLDRSLRFALLRAMEAEPSRARTRRAEVRGL